MRSRFVFVLAALVLLAAGALLPAAAPQELFVYFGTYTGAKSKGIYVSRLTLATGALSAPELAAETASPSFLAVRSQGDFLYAVNEVNTFRGKPGGSVSAFSIDRSSGKLAPLNQEGSGAEGSGGAGPAHLSLTVDGRHVLVANYGGGSVGVLPIRADGRLQPMSSFVQHSGSSVNPDRQRAPHAHQILVDPRNQFAYVADLGLDKIMIYRFDPAKHTLTAASPPFVSVTPGAGPRHVAIDRAGRAVYTINELNCTVTVFGRDAKSGALLQLQTLSTLPSGQAVERGFSTAEIVVHPSGRFVYGSNRGHDSIVVYAVDGTGKLTYLENVPTGGKTPRGFGITPGGEYLLAANQNSDSVVVFKIDVKTGRLTAAGSTVTVGSPVDVKFLAGSR